MTLFLSAQRKEKQSEEFPKAPTPSPDLRASTLYFCHFHLLQMSYHWVIQSHIHSRTLLQQLSLQFSTPSLFPLLWIILVSIQTCHFPFKNVFPLTLWSLQFPTHFSALLKTRIPKIFLNISFLPILHKQTLINFVSSVFQNCFCQGYLSLAEFHGQLSILVASDLSLAVGGHPLPTCNTSSIWLRNPILFWFSWNFFGTPFHCYLSSSPNAGRSLSSLFRSLFFPIDSWSLDLI